MAIEIIPWSEAQPNDFLLFHHLPKTAGTAVSSGLDSHYGDNRYKWFHGPAGALEELADGTSYDAIGGHFHLSHGAASRIHGHMIMVTLFRDPVDRVISNYYYLRNNDKHHLHDLAMENSLEELYDKGLGRKMQMENEIVRMVSKTGVASKKLRSAKEMVDEYTFFGLQEQTQVMELLFKQLFNTEFTIPVLMARGLRPSVNQVDLTTIRLIKEHNLEDIELYDHAKEVYERKLEKEWT